MRSLFVSLALIVVLFIDEILALMPIMCKLQQRVKSIQVTSDIKSEIPLESISNYPSKDELEHILSGRYTLSLIQNLNS